MKNLAKSSKFNIQIDFNKCHDSYLYDKKTNREYLDFFGMYASLPLGYNHSIFRTEEFRNEYLRAGTFKINNCEFTSDETLEFDRMFTEYAGKGVFKYFHYTCTGALAVESAIKTCIEHNDCRAPKVLSFNNSFHGINSYGGFVTSRFPGADARLEGFPEIFSIKVDCDLNKVEEKLSSENITCVLVEPIQCSAGDIYYGKRFFKGLRDLCDKYKVPLVFDEIQVGFGGTGKLWYYEHLDITPDIVIFGKKTQLSGIMVKEELGSIFAPGRGIRLEVTWDGDVADMIRCKYIIKAYERCGILYNVIAQSALLREGLSEIKEIQNLRNCGLIMGFDLESREYRDIIVKNLYNNGLICNRTGEKSIRLRPNLNISRKEVMESLEIFKASFARGIAQA